VIRKLALIFALVTVGILAWVLIWGGGSVSVKINGREISGPLGVAISAWGFILAAVILFCVAILLAFVFAGVGLIVLGCFVLVGLILAAIAFPFLLPLLIPLFIVWIVCSLARRSKSAQ